MTDAENGKFRHACRMGQVGAVKGALKNGVADFKQGGKTIRGWTPLHIACWGSMQPQNDKDIVEAILLAAQKNKCDDAVRGAKCKVDGDTPLDLAKFRREQLTRQPESDEVNVRKRKFDKIIEWLEKGLPSAG